VSSFMRYVGVAKPKAQGKRVASVDVQLVVQDCTGTIHATDIQFQDASLLTGWVPNTQEMLVRPRDSQGNIVPPKHYNCLIRGPKMVIIPNTGGMVATPNGQGGVTRTDPTLPPASSGVDMTITTITNRMIPNHPIHIHTYYGTRDWRYTGWTQPGDVITVTAATKTVCLNGVDQREEGNWAGPMLTSPYGDNIYEVVMTGRDAALFVFQVEEWNVAQGVTW
jgi:hypothetical protein